MISTLRMSRAMLSIAWRADRRVTSTILCVALGEAVAVAAGGLVQRMVVDAAGRDAIAGLVLAVAVGALARVALSVYWRVRVNYELDLNARIDVELNREILRWSATIPTVEHLEEGQYLDRLSLLRRNTMSIAASAWAFTGTAASVISVSLSVFLLARVHLALAALAILALPPIWAAGRAQRYLEQARAATAEDQRLEATLHELCVDAAAAKELFLSGAGSVLDAEADRARLRVLQAVLRARIHAVKWQLLSWATFATGFVGALMLTTALIQRGRASLGDVVLVITLGSALREQVHATVDGFSKIADAGHATAHYDWLRSFARDREATFAGVRPPPERLQHGIELRDVEFRYPSSDRPGVAGINLTLVAGTTVAFVGANGAGKTTLVKLLTGMYAPTGGSVLVDGIDLQEMDLSGWRARVSGTFQDFVRFELPVRSTVGIGDLTRADDAGVVADAVTGAHAHDLVAQLPHGLDTQLGRTYDGVELSHGQWQRMALARGLVRREPLLLVLDEPTAALDPLAEQEMYDLFLAQATGANGRITLLVSHRYSTVSAADHIVVMDNGRIAEQGTHADLLAIGGIYADHFAMQSRAYGQT